MKTLRGGFMPFSKHQADAGDLGAKAENVTACEVECQDKECGKRAKQLEALG